MDSILYSIKKMLGLDDGNTQYDLDLIVYINTVLTVLTQIGVGPVYGFSISSSEDTWDDFLGSDKHKLEMCKTYVSLRVKLLFDPPMSSAVTEVINTQIKELEYRIYLTQNPKNTFKE